MAAIGSLGWQVYIWLREAYWPGYSVGDVFVWAGIQPSFVSIEGWVGVSTIVNAVYTWIFELSLPLGCLFLGIILSYIGIMLYSLDIPKLEEEEEI